jgi:hypothetical protein
MRHNFGLSPFPLTERRSSSSNKKRVDLSVRNTAEPETAPAVAEEVTTDETMGGDQ